MNSSITIDNKSKAIWDFVAIKYVPFLSVLILLLLSASLYVSFNLYNTTGGAHPGLVDLIPQALALLFVLSTPYWIYKKTSKYSDEDASALGYNLPKLKVVNTILFILIYANFLSLIVVSFILFR